MLVVNVSMIPCLPFSRESAMRLAKAAEQYACAITLQTDDTTLNLKSTLGLLSQTLPADGQVRLVCDGVDERAASEAICRLVASGLKEAPAP